MANFGTAPSIVIVVAIFCMMCHILAYLIAIFYVVLQVFGGIFIVKKA